MNKDQEILAISRLVFKLTLIGDADLDETLARLHDLLHTVPSIRILDRSAILLRNDRGELVQVAQHGLPPAWASRLSARAGPDLGFGRTAYIAIPATHSPPLPLEGVAADEPVFVLPLHKNDGTPRGMAILCIAPGWQPAPVEVEFMSELAGALSVLVTRCIVNETLQVREVELEDARTDVIRRLGAASEYRDNETGMHVMRMTHFATAIAREMGLPAEVRELLAICAPMHDVGKIGIPDAILLKPGRLSDEEFEIMKRHTDIGQRLLNGEDALIQSARQIAACHHERWDGSGYPAGLAGEEIPLLARICTVSDVFDALTSTRPYKEAWPLDKAIDWITGNAGSHFDPAVVDAFLKAIPQIMRIRELYRDDIIDPNQRLDLPERACCESGWVRWDEALSVGIDVIDEHHRYLFDMTNDLFEIVANKQGSREVARVLKALDQYARVHFRAEERMMAHYGYPAIDRQQHQHHRFEARLREFYDELHNNPLTVKFDVLVYLRDWLVRHILHEDAQLRELVDDSRRQGAAPVF